MSIKPNKELENEIISKSKMVKNFPKNGVNFIDLSPIFEDYLLYDKITNEISKILKESGVNKILAIESRGFLVASPAAIKSKLPLILARKAGKIPCKPVKQEYGLEYGKAALEISELQIKKDDKIAIIDDILATGGTIEAVIKIIERLGGKSKIIIVLGDLPNLNYNKILSKYNIEIISLASFIV